jgi:hypothetical protein
MIDLATGESLTEFDAEFTADTMNQINPGASMSQTVWEDFNDFFPDPFVPADDSQFEFLSEEWDIIVNTRVDEGETPGLLSAAASRAVVEDDGTDENPPLMDDFNLAHVVIPSHLSGEWQISVIINGMPSMPLHPPGGGVFGVPEASQVLVGIVIIAGLFGAYAVRRLRKVAAAV